VHRVTRRNEDVDGLVVDDEKFAQYFETHGLGDADALAIEVQLHEELQGGQRMAKAGGWKRARGGGGRGGGNAP
jgi:hypothetical protein